MKAQNLEKIYQNAQAIAPEHIVYEADDDAMMLYFAMTKEGKTYHSKMTIDWSGLNWIISKCSKLGNDIYDGVAQKLFESNERIREYNFENVLFSVAEEMQEAA